MKNNQETQTSSGETNQDVIQTTTEKNISPENINNQTESTEKNQIKENTPNPVVNENPNTDKQMDGNQPAAPIETRIIVTDSGEQFPTWQDYLKQLEQDGGVEEVNIPKKEKKWLIMKKKMRRRRKRKKNKKKS